MGGWCLPRSQRWSLRSAFCQDSSENSTHGLLQALNQSLQKEGCSRKLQFCCRHQRNPQVVFVTCKARGGSARNARSVENEQLGLVLTQECLHNRDLMSALEKWKLSLLIDSAFSTRVQPSPPPFPPRVTFPLLLSFTVLDVESWSHRAVADRRGAFHCLVDGKLTPLADGAAVGRMRMMSTEMEGVAT